MQDFVFGGDTRFSTIVVEQWVHIIMNTCFKNDEEHIVKKYYVLIVGRVL